MLQSNKFLKKWSLLGGRGSRSSNELLMLLVDQSPYPHGNEMDTRRNADPVGLNEGSWQENRRL
jgi:hypothetical protein